MNHRPSFARSTPFLATAALALGVPASLGACEKHDAEPKPEPTASNTARLNRPRLSLSGRTPTSPIGSGPRPHVSAQPVASVKPSEDDPLKGSFTLADATKGLAGKGSLVATIDTDQGTLNCALFDDKAPITVANFVGLARGLRPWKGADGQWAKKPAYDGTVFHRIIKGFMIQGGDAAGTGAGQPGYVIPDEVWDGATHDRAGLLCMANRGPNTNGAQFFITDAAAYHLDRGYTIFGECRPLDTVHAIANVEVRGERPATAPKIKSVTIKRGPSPLASASASSDAKLGYDASFRAAAMRRSAAARRSAARRGGTRATGRRHERARTSTRAAMRAAVAIIGTRPSPASPLPRVRLRRSRRSRPRGARR